MPPPKLKLEIMNPPIISVQLLIPEGSEYRFLRIRN